MSREEFVSFIFTNLLVGDYNISFDEGSGKFAVYRKNNLPTEKTNHINRICHEAYQQFHSEWQSCWDEAKSRYENVPLIKAMK
jgi:hypothetical protein